MPLERIDEKKLNGSTKVKAELSKCSESKSCSESGDLREKLECYLKEHPGFMLKKVQVSGGFVKGKSLKIPDNIDIAAYISVAEPHIELNGLLGYLKDKAGKESLGCNVCICFLGGGLDVGLPSIIHEGNPSWRGCMVSQSDGLYLEGSIPLNLGLGKECREGQFDRSDQVVRLVKYWAANEKRAVDGFESFMVELIMTKSSNNEVRPENEKRDSSGFFYVFHKCAEKNS